MIAYRCQASGGQKDFSASYTVTTVHNNVESKWPSSCYELFSNDQTFNRNVIIGNNVAIGDRMFLNCRALNTNIYIPDNMKSCRFMFWGCENLNQNIRIPNNANIYGMFTGCYRLNQNIQIPEGQTNLDSLFAVCSNLNQPIKIPDSAIDIRYMFGGCSNFNQDMIIPENVMECSRLFVNCYEMHKNIYFKGKNYRNLLIDNLIYTPLNAFMSINIFFNHALNNIFNTLWGSWTSWTPMENGFYNETWHVNCYYNYPG